MRRHVVSRQKGARDEEKTQAGEVEMGVCRAHSGDCHSRVHNHAPRILVACSRRTAHSAGPVRHIELLGKLRGIVILSVVKGLSRRMTGSFYRKG